MSKETEIIIKQMLYQILKSKTLKEAQNAIKFLATKEDIAEALQLIREEEEAE